jgi:lipid-binding SYLF domain-containing protein
VGQGAQTATADILSFARSKGAFVGAALDGTVVKPAEELNEGFYGKPVSPVDILVRGNVKNAKADALRSAVAQAAKGKK